MELLQWGNQLAGASLPRGRDKGGSIYGRHTAKTISVAVEKISRRADIFVLPFDRNFQKTESVGGLK
jgi:hypothetical protein